MIDTLKLSLEAGTYGLLDRTYFNHTESKGIKKYIRNPSKSELASGRYLPNITAIQRPAPSGAAESLNIEFSAPKLIYGNNFDELIDDQLEQVLLALLDALTYMNVYVTYDVLLNAKVCSWHPSKNVIFNDYFGCSTVINALHKADASKVYSIKKVDFSDGEVLHIHCNSKDIAFYDKLADLSRGKISDKKSFEKQNRVQTTLLEDLIRKHTSVLRYEVRFNTVRAVRQAIKHYTTESPSLTVLFSSKLSQQILEHEWRTATRYIDLLALDRNDPLVFFEKYLVKHPSKTPQSALAGAMSMYIASTAGTKAFRKSIDSNFGAHTWYRVKPLIEIDPENRHTYFRHVDRILKDFKPVNLNTLITDINL